MPERKREDARGRFRVGDIGDSRMWRDLKIAEGDIINAPEGFPAEDTPDFQSAPGARSTVTQERPLHPVVAYYLGELYEKGVLEPVD